MFGIVQPTPIEVRRRTPSPTGEEVHLGQLCEFSFDRNIPKFDQFVLKTMFWGTKIHLLKVKRSKSSPKPSQNNQNLQFILFFVIFWDSTAKNSDRFWMIFENRARTIGGFFFKKSWKNAFWECFHCPDSFQLILFGSELKKIIHLRHVPNSSVQTRWEQWRIFQNPGRKKKSDGRTTFFEHPPIGLSRRTFRHNRPLGLRPFGTITG